MFPFYNKMRLSDAQVNATQLMLKLPLKGARWIAKPVSSDPQDVAIADFVQHALIDGDLCASSWQRVLDNALLKFDFGCSAEEVVWGYDDTLGAAIVKDPAPLDKIEATLKGLRSHDRGYLVQPFGVEYDWLTSTGTGERMQGLVLFIEHHNLMIARNILQSFAAQGEQRHGSYGAASVTAD